MMEQTQIVHWGLHNREETEEAGKRISELNAEGYVMRFFRQTQGNVYAYCTAIMIRVEAEPGAESQELASRITTVHQHQSGSVGSTQVIS